MADFSQAYPNHKLLSPMSVYPSVKVAVKVGEGGGGEDWGKVGNVHTQLSHGCQGPEVDAEKQIIPKTLRVV